MSEKYSTIEEDVSKYFRLVARNGSRVTQVSIGDGLGMKMKGLVRTV